MSADDTIYVQKNKKGDFVAQHGFMSSPAPPDPNKADPSQRFLSLEGLVEANQWAANNTEYGFTILFPNSPKGPNVSETPTPGKKAKPTPPLKVEKFQKRPLIVEVVKVTERNMEQAAEWCRGTIETDDKGKRYIQVKVHRPLNDRQAMAYAGDRILYLSSTGFKCYQQRPFDKSFEPIPEGKKVSRSSKDGKFVTHDEVKAHPESTVTETV